MINMSRNKFKVKDIQNMYYYYKNPSRKYNLQKFTSMKYSFLINNILKEFALPLQ